MSYKISACCQLGELTTNRKGETVFTQFNDCKVGTITVKSMSTLSPTQQRVKLLGKVKQNLNALRSQIKRVAAFSDDQKMFRITSDLFPLYTHLDYNHLYDDEMLQLIKSSLSVTGKLIIDNGIRVSTHPSQYTTLSSDKDHVIDNSIRDLESHVFLFECLGLNPVDHGVVINIHANGKSFTLPERASHLFPWISLENDEKLAGHEKCLMLCEKYGIRYVFDLHHYYCETGDYLDVNSEGYQRIQNTWPEGVRPIIHLSQSRGDTNKREMCAHSDMITDQSLIEYFANWLYHSDCDLEAKHKNVASAQLAKDVIKFTDFN
ncbi:putative UV DNA damage repair endonuclease UvsE [Vibrio phage 277E43-1]|nr:putative UV DNA damage repair endonuclease UvsE [Vibrio phage 277E43-1]